MNNRVAGLQTRIGELKKELSAVRRGGAPEPVKDYEFRGPDGSPVKLGSLFGGKADLILIHNMGRKCPYCTLWADGFIGVWKHLADRAGFVVASADEPNIMKEFAAGRGWEFPMVSYAGTTFAKDMGYEPKPGDFYPGVSAFAKRGDGTIVRTGTAPFGPGDDFCVVWPMLDLLEGGAKGWEPKYAYKRG